MADNNDFSEKTSIVSGDTFSGKLKAADDAPPALIVLMGPQGYVGKQWLLTEKEYTIGRAIESNIFLDDSSVSRNHARISVLQGEANITDLGSSNKTIINGATLNPNAPIKLRNNDQIKTGNIIFKFLERGNIEAMANQQLNEKAIKDALTGAFSKGALLEKGPEAVKRAEFLNEELTVLVFDIDYFKKINDTFGHAAGDMVLKELSKIVSTKLVRSQDFFARYGGEEFVIILTSTGEKPAQDVAERIRTTVEGAMFEFESKKIPVTISIGIATRKFNEVEWKSLFDRADKAMYQSKQSGRNKVSTAS
jgi:two-component system cell cycle response regulator